MVLGDIVNGVDSLISLSIFLLSMYKKVTDFCTLTLYPATLLNCCMSSSSLGVKFWVFHIKYHVICEERDFFLFANLNTFYFLVLSDCCC